MTSQPLRVETATANQIPLSASKAVSQAHHDALWIARDRLLAELSPQERGMFTDCETWEDVIKSIQLSPAYQKHSRSQLRRMLGPIERFSRGLAPFFDVISILVSARPEWAAVFWGSLRLVLTLASNYLSYFAKIGKLLEDLLKELPRFREIHNIISVKGEAMGETNDQKSGFKRYDQSTNKIGLGHYMVEVETPKDPKIAVNESQDPTKPGISISSSSTQANRSSDDRLFESDAEIPRRLHPMAEASRSRISDSIISIYQNIMAMLQELVKVFAHQNGTPKSSLRVLCGTIWRSFDERVMDWTEEIRKQKAFLVDEMAVIEFRLTIEAYGERRSERELHFRAEREADAKSRSKSTRKRKERIRTKARVWIAPPEFAEEHEQASEARVEGTTEWFGDHDQISRWRTDELDPTVGTILWVHGNAGTGKTTLAAALIDELREEAGITVLYFYFTQTSSCKKRTSDSALRSILAQIVQQHPDSEPLLDALALTMSDRFGGQLKATFRELLELAQLVLSTILENTRIVLDGIDECEDFDQLLPMISFLADQNSPVKFLLLSRPGVQSLLKMVDEDDCMNLNDPMISEYTRHDIRHYLAREVSSMIAHGELSIIDYSAASYVDKLALGSNGMFLWARLAIRLLQSPALTLGQKKEIVQSIVLPEGLEKIYDRMLERMSTRSVTVQDLARKLLVLLTYGILGDFPLRFSEDMLSYKLKGPDRSGHLRITLLCLDYLDSTMPRLPICNGRDSETAAIRDGLEKGRPFMKYALAYWPHHLSSIVKAIRPIARWQGLRDSLIRYLGNQFMLLAGIEAHYLLGVKLPVVTQHLFSFADCIISGHMESESIHVPKDIKILAGNLADFGRDLLQIEAIWGERLCQQPYLIWHDVTAFIDCHFLRPTRATTVSHLMPELHDESFSSRPISSKSVLSLDGQRIAILSVWSSREFECEYRRSVASPGRNYKLDTFESFKPLCKGWKATYKIKTTQLPLLTVHSVELDIAPSDIWCRVLEGLRPNQASGSDFTFSIPLSIARKDLRTFSIMQF
ncbi:hypothetical protein BJ508DRAFT_128555 [Ascobolus immersus RN42]|uniref:NACHT domain-containing protein n=1 Tax=Ascobolus immersus RN42 TaxID=1160509 RepID=A0A3N4I578_ASCIM|nr:hypothetical protein BJ508DRAFT_128555 [Ascobolus immersus RN42]